jgi:hypothetical protein
VDSAYHFFYKSLKYLSFHETIIALASGLKERNILIAIDCHNNFYKIDVEEKKIVYQSDISDGGSFGSVVCIMNTREENWLACSKWTYEDYDIEIRDCDDFSLNVRFKVRA